jgi:hypothetical protein
MTTKTLDDYMNDPDIINEPMPLREIHAIRLMHYDEQKDMTPEEQTELIRKRTEPIIKQYNMRVAAHV